ncbi:hypothetical protein P5P86_15245 [Nocardioides sp. BP30]|uniref:hypothetical protein n=1 Tax=Nocardioides sp. BP30 TaxID=3036374 RepID=UPI0024691A9F|nr:hypothetical protein [Nocardioides sp. BP30]WGL51309.1 hypothetical protein P5P86_15245 [Nocardioides sp. BP30]
MRARSSTGLRQDGAELTEEMRALLAPHFEAVGEALAAGISSVDACWVVGRTLAELGSSLGEGLEGLRATTQLVARRDPLFEESQALSLTWSDATLSYLHGLSCADPLTGLSTHAHLRERIAELYRDAVLSERDTHGSAGPDVSNGHALVVADAGGALDPISAAHRLSLLGQVARSVFAGETIAQVGHGKVVVLAPRREALPGRVALLRRMVSAQAQRVWVEGLPSTDAAAVSLLDELARA